MCGNKSWSRRIPPTSEVKSNFLVMRRSWFKLEWLALKAVEIIEAHEVSTTRSKSPMFFGSRSEDARRFVTCYCGVVTSVVTSIGL